MDLDGATVVITGGSTGIGRAAAQLLATRGARLVLAARRADRLEPVVEELREAGADVIGVPTDIARYEDVAHLADVAFETFGTVDVGLFNAGVSGIDNLLDPDLAAWRTAIDTNVYGLLHCIKAFVPRMVAQDRPTAVYATSSGAGVHGTTYFTAPYATTKNAQLSIMESLYGQARDAKVQLKVGVVLPPMTRTNLAGDDLSIWDHVVENMSKNGRDPVLIEPEEFAHVIVDGIEQERFWVAATAEDDERYFGGRYSAVIERTRRTISAKATAMAEHTPPDPYLW